MKQLSSSQPSLGRRRFLARLGALFCAMLTPITLLAGHGSRLARREASFYRKAGE